jgi:hypothetical protein
MNCQRWRGSEGCGENEHEQKEMRQQGNCPHPFPFTIHRGPPFLPFKRALYPPACGNAMVHDYHPHPILHSGFKGGENHPITDHGSKSTDKHSTFSRRKRGNRRSIEREGEAYLRFQTSVCRSASSSGQGARVAVREEEQAAGVEMGCLGGAGVRRRGDAKNVRGVGLRARGERGGGVGGHPVQCIPTPVLFANERREGWCSGAARVGLHCFSERADGRGGRKRVSPCCCDANVNARARAVRDGTGREARRRAWKWAVWVGRGWRRRQRKTSLAFACHGASHSSAHGPCEKAPHVLIECNLGLPPI